MTCSTCNESLSQVRAETVVCTVRSPFSPNTKRPCAVTLSGYPDSNCRSSICRLRVSVVTSKDMKRTLKISTEFQEIKRKSAWRTCKRPNNYARGRALCPAQPLHIAAARLFDFRSGSKSWAQGCGRVQVWRCGCLWVEPRRSCKMHSLLAAQAGSGGWSLQQSHRPVPPRLQG